MDKLVTWIIFVVSCAHIATVEACFPHNYWISCLLNTCKLGGKCPGDPTAQCRMDKSECNGCKAVWYRKDGSRANCTSHHDLKLCPGGEPVEQCLVNTCWPCSHPDFKAAECRQTYCGSCSAEYLVQGIWRVCPTDTQNPTGSELPFDGVVADSSKVGCKMVPCSIEVCFATDCPAFPRAVCRPDGCNQCKAAWFLDNSRVNCRTGEFVKELPLVNNPVAIAGPWQRDCAVGQPLVACGEDVCYQKTCRNYPNAVCRPDGCGSCKDTWYVDNQLVDCLSDACPPKVPFVKCVDDPCKYFSHYCPAAECRASQCGKCEAKFFSNGVEVDCVQPPKQCPAGIQPQSCPWFTCPANICPSNDRLMCRIDPCGPQCKYEWVDIYNGEVMGCRTFDGRSGPDPPVPAQSEKIFLRDPLMSMFEPHVVPSGPLFIEAEVSQKKITSGPSNMAVQSQSQGQNWQSAIDPALKQAILDQSFSSDPNFAVEPIFVKPAPPIVETDVNGLLRSFPHEIQAMSSTSIKDALKKHRAGVTAVNPFDIIPPGSMTPVDIGQVMQDNVIVAQKTPEPTKKAAPFPAEFHADASVLKPVFPTQTASADGSMMGVQHLSALEQMALQAMVDSASVVSNPVLNAVKAHQDIPATKPKAHQDIPVTKPKMHQDILITKPKLTKPAVKPMYPELNFIPGPTEMVPSLKPVSGVNIQKPVEIVGPKASPTNAGWKPFPIIPPVKPSHMTSTVVTSDAKPQPIPTVKPSKFNTGPINGLPISMGVFSSWAASM